MIVRNMGVPAASETNGSALDIHNHYQPGSEPFGFSLVKKPPVPYHVRSSGRSNRLI